MAFVSFHILFFFFLLILSRQRTSLILFPIFFFFFFNDTATTEIYTLSLHDALPIYVVTDHAVHRQNVHVGVGATNGRRTGAVAAAGRILVGLIGYAGNGAQHGDDEIGRAHV